MEIVQIDGQFVPISVIAVGCGFKHQLLDIPRELAPQRNDSAPEQ